MSHPYARSRRVADLIRRELALIIQREAQDPRFAQITISQVQLSRDLSFAKIYVGLLDQADATEVVLSLNKASGFFRHSLANIVNMRGTPKLRFYLDERVKNKEYIENLIDDSQINFIDYSKEEGFE